MPKIRDRDEGRAPTPKRPRPANPRAAGPRAEKPKQQAQAAPSFTIPPGMAARSRMRADLARAAADPVQPFAVDFMRMFPPGVGPADVAKTRAALDAGPSRKIAMDAGAKLLGMDEAGITALSWANSAISSIFQEGQTFMGYPYLSELAQRPEYRCIVETIAQEMTRKWIELTTTDEETDKTDRIKQLNEYLDMLHVRDAFSKMVETDGFFGRTHLYLDTGDTEDREELKTSIGSGGDTLSPTKVNQKKPLRAVRPVEPIWCYPASYNSNDPLSALWYNPQSWFVMAKELHSSRLLTLVGREVPDLLKPAYSFGGLAMTQMAKPYVDNWLRTRQAVADLIYSFTVFVLGTDLQATLGDDGEQLFRRVELFNAFRNNQGLMVRNTDTEELDNVSAPLGSLDALQAQSQEQMCAVARIPSVKMLGIEPKGFNATSEGTIRTFYDSINAYQERFLRRALTRVLHFSMLSLWGEIDPSISFKFVPLWALDEKGEAEVDKIEAETGAILIESGVISPEEERKRVASDAGTPYQGLDPNDVPDLLEEEEEGLVPKGGGAATRAALEGREDEAGGDNDEQKEAADEGVIPGDKKIAADPPVSEKQARAMHAAAEGRSTLGIPKSVGEEFVGKAKK